MNKFTTLMMSWWKGTSPQRGSESNQSPSPALTIDSHMFHVFTCTVTLRKLNSIPCFREEYMPKQYSPLGKSQSCQDGAFIPLSNHFIEVHKGEASVHWDFSLVHSPPGMACHETLKPLPPMKLSVLNLMASSCPVLETCMGFSGDLLVHSWAILGEWKSGPP